MRAVTASQALTRDQSTDGLRHVGPHQFLPNWIGVRDLEGHAEALNDLNSAAETREIADQVNDIGRMDAVIHNAGVFLEPSRSAAAEGHAKTLAVNTLAPYMLTALTDRLDRLIYLSSGLHHAGAGSLRDINWTRRQWNAARAGSAGLSVSHCVAARTAAWWSLQEASPPRPVSTAVSRSLW